ncbi:hypothetical protein EYS14_00170 [Alteromonadaceae bacterium M269]|nr:hypothetical protein EYS14_00170 [Alteromonadaceae bacterium M269]
MNKEDEIIETYREMLYFFRDILNAQIDCDSYVRRIIKGEDLIPLDQAIRDFVEEELELDRQAQ